MFRISAIVLSLFAASCAAAPAPAPIPPADDHGGRPSDAEIFARSRVVLEKNAAEVLGPAALAEVRSARTFILVQRAMSLPPAVRQPDGSWKVEPPSVAAAVRTSAGWIRIGRDNARQAFDSAAAAELDRLLAGPLWAEPPIAAGSCTDPSGIVVLVRHSGRERISNQPCGLIGATGQVAQIVLAGRVTDWSNVPPERRPPGIPLARFDPSAVDHYRFTSGITEERHIEIRTPAEWHGQWRRLTARHGNPPPPPEVDFSREMVLLAASGAKGSGGYSVTIERVLESPGELVAYARHVSPGPRCGTIAVITHPVDLVRIPASAKPVRWVAEREVRDCP